MRIELLHETAVLAHKRHNKERQKFVGEKVLHDSGEMRVIILVVVSSTMHIITLGYMYVSELHGSGDIKPIG